MSPPVWFITAASSGFGHGIALEALSRGFTVIATARNSSKLTDLATKGAITADLDVTHDLETLTSTVAALHARAGGRFDVFINAAGYILEGAIEEARYKMGKKPPNALSPYAKANTKNRTLTTKISPPSPKETYDCFNTNVLGLLNATRAILPHMRQQRSGRIALFGSLGSWSGAPGAGIYCATKWAVSGLAESLRSEVADLGIGVCVIEPGYFRTGFLNSGARVRTGRRIGDYEEGAVGEMRGVLDAYDGEQPGNLGKGAKVIVDCFSREGSSGDGEVLPVRLVLGSDCRAGIEGKCRRTLEYLEREKEVIDGTDREGGE